MQDKARFPKAHCLSRSKIRPETMDNSGPPNPSDIASTSTIAVRSFSKTIALTYVGLGLLGVLLPIRALNDFLRAIVSGSSMYLLSSAVALALGLGSLYLIFALRQRRNWARYAAVLFWVVCLIWTSYRIGRNGLHPEPPNPAGPLHYSNADQVAGARFSALTTPYFMAMLESIAVYCLLRKTSLVSQFTKPGGSSPS